MPRISLLLKKARWRASVLALMAETGFDFCVLGVMRFDEKCDLADRRGQRRRITARHARRRVDDNKAIVQLLRHFFEQGLRFLGSTTTLRRAIRSAP